MNLDQSEAAVRKNLDHLEHAIDGITEKFGAVSEKFNGLRDWEAQKLVELKEMGRDATELWNRNRIPVLVSAALIAGAAFLLRASRRESY